MLHWLILREQLAYTTLVFADAYGSTPLTAGFYHATGSITGGNDWFEVSSAGVVIDLGVCAAVSYACDGFCYDPGDGSGPYATLEECELACSTPGTAEINYSLTLENGVNRSV